ncbi:16S rRNA (guanine(966)-N(2))-methyltransferase RsmD [Enterobacteriaceae endosymbiont of Neohaemonia nigricornis]|uniref:16S rRNA (guanine(966)-N(2))-methyltransferase RsmD n=1 Tax=Enterobacteriaceae endosymbiont of Neohaemonia nigricornis TaxID=2675792 RepID=UPI001448F783|nr:16S rRNA (guanine(966)-N(2))-methyltransferase RsmD [Enterobacteriaceae endosymbiont of Neohaemonia nigricornis]QJC30235.1 16S rRNA (guanine(966)-N(2))-methyltransferase RsmD [Enterobacteriaceae endosymbiont of Neohaemonia nigricornis]
MRKIYIITGKWKYKSIYVINHNKLKPTMNFIRANLFNWLTNNLHMMKCLDCFAGTGSLSLEALSRNALSATLIENNYHIFIQLKKNIMSFNKINISLIYDNIINFISYTSETFDLVFIDPPFNINNTLLSQVCMLLEKHACLNPNALIYIEYMANSKNLFLPSNWIKYREKQFSYVTYALYKKNN